MVLTRDFRLSFSRVAFETRVLSVYQRDILRAAVAAPQFVPGSHFTSQAN